MTDKQIKEVFKNGFYCIEPCPEIKELQAELKAKEQECKELKKIINEAKNSKLDLKSFLVGEAVQNEYEQQLDQLKDEYKILEDNLDSRTRDFEDVIDGYKQTLTEIKEIAEDCMKQDICTLCDNSEKCHIEDEEIPTYDVCKLILQKISECEVVE